MIQRTPAYLRMLKGTKPFRQLSTDVRRQNRSCRPASTQLTETRLEVWTTVSPFTFMKGSAKAVWSATTTPRRARAAYTVYREASKRQKNSALGINIDVIRHDLNMSHSHNEDPYRAGSALPCALCLLSELLWCRPHQPLSYVEIHGHHLFLHHSNNIWRLWYGFQNKQPRARAKMKRRQFSVDCGFS